MTDGDRYVDNSPPVPGEPQLPATNNADQPGGADGAPREFRIAVVMTGGVSLCVWMGGTAYELDRLRRKEGIYGKLFDAIDSEPVVDIIGGTSAGGLNGTLLASAIAWGSDLSGLAEVWYRLADFAKLLQPLSARKLRKTGNSDKPLSLLQGDTFFLPNVKDVLDQLQAKGKSPQIDGTRTLHLIVTTTTLKPWDQPYEDSEGTAFSEATHQGLFHFTKNEQHDDFNNADSAEALARTARASASFPAAFEASYVQVEKHPEDGVDKEPYIDLPVSRYVIDGGVVDNDPLDVVLDAIASQPAQGPVHRTILFVNPLGAATTSPEATPKLKPPSVFEVLEGTLLIPRQHSNVLLYNKLGLRESQAGKFQAFRANLFRGITPSTSDQEPVGADAATIAASLVIVAEQMRPGVRNVRKSLRLAQNDQSDEDQQSNRQSLLIVQDLLRRTLTRYQSLVPEVLGGLIGLRTEVSAALRSSAPGSSATVEDLLNRAMTALVEVVGSTDSDAPVRSARARARLTVEVAGIRAMAVAAAKAAGEPDQTRWSQALDDLGVLQSAVTDGDVHNPQQIKFIELSAFNEETSTMLPSEKLDGVQMAHFGAFYAESWRHNDWIWGRLDGSFRLLAMIVDPELLLEVGDSGSVAEKIASVLEGSPAQVATFKTEIESKLNAFTTLEPGKERRAQAVEIQLFIAKTLWEQERTAILRAEFPGLITSAQSDIRGGLLSTPTLDKFITSNAHTGDGSTPQQLTDAWKGSPVGRERLSGQLRSKRFELLATQAAAIGVTVLDDGTKWAAARWVLKPLSWPFQAAHSLIFYFRRSDAN